MMGPMLARATPFGRLRREYFWQDEAGGADV